MIGRRARAGRYARERYLRGLRSWRRRNRWLFVRVSGPFVVAGLAIGIATGEWLPWFGGFGAGGFAMMWMAFRETPPRYVEKWLDGADGERRTEKSLLPLERAGWKVVHDIRRRYGNYDHVAVGRAGVYLLETKNLQGVVQIKNGVPHLTRRHDPEDRQTFERIPRQAKAAAAALKEEIEQSTGRRGWVQALVVFWSEFPDGLIEEGNCVFIHGSRLRAWFESRPTRLTQAEVDEIAGGVEAIASRESAATAASSTPEPVKA